MKKIVVPACVDELPKVNEFITEELENYGCSMRVQMQVEMAVEEIFVNISTYAYNPDIGEAVITMDIDENEPVVTITFLDNGRPFDPLSKEDVDITLPPEERDIGGLGILLVKKSMDNVSYSYEDGKNILTIKKKL